MTRARSAVAFPPRALAIAVALLSAWTAAGMRSALSPDKPKAEMASATAATGDANALPQNGPLIAGPNSNYVIFANRIALRLKMEGKADISAVGPAASYIAFKALIVANKYMAQNFTGKSLAMLPSMREISLPDREAMGFMLEVRPIPAIVEVEEPDTYTGSDTNAGALSVYMTQTFKERDMVTIGAMGARAMYSVLKATVYAQSNMTETAKEGGKVQLALVPSFGFFEKGGETLSRMLLACVRTKK